MAEIDSLDIKIQTDAKNTVNAIEELDNKLGKLVERLSGLSETPGLSEMAEKTKSFPQAFPVQQNKLPRRCRNFPKMPKRFEKSLKTLERD